MADSVPPSREVGYVSPGSGNSWWQLDDEQEETPELRWPASVKIYARMMTDSKVRSSIRAVKSPLLSTSWRIEQGHASDEVTQYVSRQLGLPIKGVEDSAQVHDLGRRRGRFSWKQHLAWALEFLEFGHAVFEQKVALDESTGRYDLVKLGPRDQASISKFEVARDGGLIAVRQKPPGLVQGGAGDVPLAVSRLVVYSHERRGGNWWGQSILRPVYKHWLIADRLMRVNGQQLDRNGMGIPVVEHDVRLVTGDDASGTAAQNAERIRAMIDSGQEIAQSVRAGDNSGASMTPGAKLRLVGVEGQLPDVLKSVQFHYDQVGGAVLANFLNLGRQTGSWALGTTFKDFFVASLNQVGDLIADTATAHIVEDLVDWSFSIDEPAPRIVYDDLSGQDEALAYAIKALVDSGVITPDDALQAYLRAAYKLPERSGAREPDDTSTPTTGDDQ